MDIKNLKKVILGFINNRFSADGNRLFFIWFKLKNDHHEKEEILKELWNADFDLKSNTTYSDWDRLKQTISISPKRKINHYYLISAAIILILLLPLPIAYLFSGTNNSESPISILSYAATHGEQKEITLSDSTKVIINAGSMLLAPNSFQDTKQREVYLVGKAHFDVAQDPTKPFIVHTAKLEIAALGTQFAISSYFEETTTQAILEEGCIQVKVNDAKHSSIHTLRPLEKLIYNHMDSSVEIRQIDNEQIRLYQQGYIIFENASFKEIINTIERQYNVAFQYDISKYADGLYHVKFSPNEELEDVLRILKELLNFKYTIKGRCIYLK